jgi:hypothetical protein
MQTFYLLPHSILWNISKMKELICALMQQLWVGVVDDYDDKAHSWLQTMKLGMLYFMIWFKCM